MDPHPDTGVKKFFVKILNTVALGLLWMMASATAGIYYKLGYLRGNPLVYTIVFYAILLSSLVLLLLYFHKIWKKDK